MAAVQLTTKGHAQRYAKWLDAPPTGSLTAAAQALGVAITEVAEMIERARMQ